jgi:hypothetical protein
MSTTPTTAPSALTLRAQHRDHVSPKDPLLPVASRPTGEEVNMQQTKRPRRPILIAKAQHVATEAPCPTPLTQSVLESHSNRPSSGTVSITPKCHRRSGMTVGYSWVDGCAVLACAKCGAGVARLQLAKVSP